MAILGASTSSLPNAITMAIPGNLETVLSLLSRHHVLTLACRDEQGSWAAAVFYANDGLDLYFMSSARSRHACSLAFDPRLAGAIHGAPEDWRSIVGLQLSGLTEAVPAADLARARSIYASRFPFVAGLDATDPALAKALGAAAWYRLRIEEAVIIDNTQGLGQRARWSRPTPGFTAPAAGSASDGIGPVGVPEP